MRNAGSIVILLAVVLFSCGDGSGGYETLTLDEHHNQKESETNNEHKTYQIKSCDGVVIDATNYYFKVPENLSSKEMELIHLVDSSNIYEAEWSATNKVTLDKNSLTQIQGEKVFEGFKDGQRIIFGIGTREEAEDGTPALGVTYVAVVIVKE